MRPYLLAGSVALFHVAIAHRVDAQVVARVAAKERLIEKRSSETTPWLKAKVGAALEQDNRFRTRKRSKADILFSDKSLIRLGQLSTLYIENAKQSKLTEGELLFSRLTPGRIVAGAGIAGIKGSVGIIRLNEDGSALFSLISGAMDVDTVRGDRVTLAPGQAVLVFADGSLSALRVAAPLVSSGTGSGFGSGSGGGSGGSGGGLGQAPVDSPFAGSTTNITVRSSPARLSSDQGSTSGNSVVAQNANPFRQAVPTGGGVLPAEPPIDIFPNARVAPRLAANQIVAAQTLGETTTTDVAQAAADMDTTLAEAHIGEVVNGSRYSGLADIEMIGALSDGGTYAYGGHLHTFLNKGPLSADVALLPLRLRFKGPTGPVSRDISAVSSASVSYVHRLGDIQIGRQRFFGGPTQAALFGSLVRQGARDVMDAVRVAPNIGKNRRLDLAYIHDAFPRNLPYRVPGKQKAYYGRFGVQTPRGNFGANLLHYTNLPVSTTTGATVDFVFPLRSGEIEFYGELGRDTFRRGITTFGLTFPGLYERTDFDVYLETATLSRRGSTAPIPPTEYSLRVYKKLNRNSNLIVQLQHFNRSQTSATIGFSFGAHLPFSG